MRITINGDKGWNGNDLSALERNDGAVLICVHESNDDPECGETALIPRDELLSLAAMLAARAQESGE